jgi:hypothetical protein
VSAHSIKKVITHANSFLGMLRMYGLDGVSDAREQLDLGAVSQGDQRRQHSCHLLSQWHAKMYGVDGTSNVQEQLQDAIKRCVP